MDITQARSNAIDQQIRPWGGLNYIANKRPSILGLSIFALLLRGISISAKAKF